MSIQRTQNLLLVVNVEKSFDVFGTYDKSNTFVIFNTFDKIVWSNIDSIPAPVWNMGGLN